MDKQIIDIAKTQRIIEPASLLSFISVEIDRQWG